MSEYVLEAILAKTMGDHYRHVRKILHFLIASSGRVADLLEETKGRGRILGRAVFLLGPVLTGGGFAH